MNANQIDRGELVKTGAFAGAQAGCLASSLFVVLLIAYVILGQLWWRGLETLGRLFELIPVALYSFVIGALVGVIPATMIGAFAGTVIAWCFYMAQRWLINARVAAGFGAVLGVALTLPFLFGWWIWIYSAEIFTEAGVPITLLFILICGGTGAYRGLALWRTLH
jgi:hypothetical protein